MQICWQQCSCGVCYSGVAKFPIHIIVIDFKLSSCSECLCFILGISPAFEFYMPTFRNTLFHLHRRIGMKND